MQSIARLLFFVLVSAGLAAPAAAQKPVDLAEQALKALEFRKAKELATQTIQAADAEPGDLARAYRVLGWAQAVRGKKAEAVLNFRRLLSLDPAFRLGKGVSPKIRGSFYEAAGMARDAKPVALQHEPPSTQEKLAGTRLRVALLSDPMGLVQGLRFRYLLPGGERREMTVMVKGPSKVSFKLPDDYEQERFRYWFEAVSPHGGVVARAASPDEPFTLKAKPKPVIAKKPEPVIEEPLVASPPPEVEDEGRWYTSWWFWTAVGVVVAGATTGAVLAATAESEDPLHWDVEVR